jgi:hypothetical protein
MIPLTPVSKLNNLCANIDKLLIKGIMCDSSRSALISSAKCSKCIGMQMQAAKDSFHFKIRVKTMKEDLAQITCLLFNSDTEILL